MHSSKACFKCGKTLPLTEFYKHPAMGDGHLGKCKQCTKKDVTEHREKNIDKIREYDRTRSKLPHRKSLAVELHRVWRKEDARRDKCHRAVSRAILNGTITRLPCEVCGSEKSQAHHEDYDKPLDVMWLCAQHHCDRHKKLKEDF
jgi:hypothetical protein